MAKIELEFWRTAEALYEIDNTANTRESNEMDELQFELSEEMLCCEVILRDCFPKRADNLMKMKPLFIIKISSGNILHQK